MHLCLVYDSPGKPFHMCQTPAIILPWMLKVLLCPWRWLMQRVHWLLTVHPHCPGLAYSSAETSLVASSKGLGASMAWLIWDHSLSFKHRVFLPSRVAAYPVAPSVSCLFIYPMDTVSSYLQPCSRKLVYSREKLLSLRTLGRGGIIQTIPEEIKRKF